MPAPGEGCGAEDRAEVPSVAAVDNASHDAEDDEH